MDDVRAREGAYRMRHELQLQRRTGIKVKMEFENPQWWTREFVNYMGSIASAKGISAARSYVKSGKVLEVNVMPGVVEAQVQGRRKAPYQVRLYTPLPTDEQLAEAKRRLSDRALYGALLLSGEMPEAVSDIFTTSGIPLIPQNYARRQLLCSCPEPENICKHILAVLYVVTAVFDHDPFILLKMRGLEKDELLASLSCARNKNGAAAASVTTVTSASDKDFGEPERSVGGKCEEPVSQSFEYPLDATFYGSPSLPRELEAFRADNCDGKDATKVHAPLFDFPLWRGETSFRDSIHPYYESVQKLLKSK